MQTINDEFDDEIAVLKEVINDALTELRQIATSDRLGFENSMKLTKLGRDIRVQGIVCETAARDMLCWHLENNRSRSDEPIVQDVINYYDDMTDYSDDEAQEGCDNEDDFHINQRY
jgi:hypothetical protein